MILVFWTLSLLISSAAAIKHTPKKPITGDTITGETITGEATSDSVALTITITATTPTLTINKPRNETYFYNHTIPIDITTNSNDTWYNIDNTNNVSFNATHETFFNTSIGNHTLHVFANNSAGLTKKNVTFFTNTSIYHLNFDKYFNSSNKGNSTNCHEFSLAELNNISNLILEDVRTGKIMFNSIINFTNDANPNDNITDLDSYINITFNKILLDSNALPNLNITATLELKDLTFTNPRILFNDQVCPATICVKNSYANGVLNFNITHFSTFSSEETPTPSDASGSSSSTGGGAGGSITSPKKSPPIEPPSKELQIGTKTLAVSILQGQTKQQRISLRNNNKQPLILNITLTNLEDLILIQDNTLTFQPGASHELAFDIIARETKQPGVYLGKIILIANNIQYEIPIAITVNSAESLFDIRLSILGDTEALHPGKDMLAQIEIFTLGTKQRVDTLVEYKIQDAKGKTILTEKETLALETQVSFVKRLKLPRSLTDEHYILEVLVYHDNKVTGASTWFSIAKKEDQQKTTITAISIGITILIITLTVIVILFSRIRHKKKYKQKQKPQIKTYEPRSKSRIETYR